MTQVVDRARREKPHAAAEFLTDRVDAFIRSVTPFTPTLGLARSLIALATFATLLATPTDQLFFRSAAIPLGANCHGAAAGLSLFCLVDTVDGLETARWIAIGVLAIAISGISPAVTALPHWWVAWSVATSSTAVDGGDHLAADLTLLLVPICLLDRRLWHWSHDGRYGTRSPWVAYSAYAVLGLWVLQMACVYFQASVAKFAVAEWADGTALWYWMQNPVFAPPEPIAALTLGLLQSLPLSIAATYGTLALQLALAFAVFLPQRTRHTFLVLAVAFHLVIALLMGLWSFSIVMIAADMLLLIRPNEVSRAEIWWRSSRRQKGDRRCESLTTTSS